MKKSNLGISLISLIITIIVIIILAAIVIFSGLGTPDSANLAKFTSEFADFNLAVDNAYMKEVEKNALSNQSRSKKQVYYEIATGIDVVETNAGNVNQVPEATGTVSALETQVGKIYPETIEGTEYYTITSDTNVHNWKNHKQYFEETEVHYLTDEGEAFFLPGYLVQEDDGSQKWFINETKYYYGNKIVGNGTGGNGGSNPGEDDSSETIYANSPTLTSGMIPVYHDGSVWKKADSTNTTAQKWYDYDAKQWANMVTVKDSVRDTYETAPAGTPIVEEDVIGYFVWIPRYAYQLNTSNQMADIVFLKETTNEFTNGVVGEENSYITHPVFTNNPSAGGWDSELRGIWVAKFESSSSETQLVDDDASQAYTTKKAIDVNGNPITVVASGNGKVSSTLATYGRTGSSTEYVTVRPGVTSWRVINVNNIVSKSSQMASKHGISVDSHMMKNTEWGAVAYLTQSKYGNTSIWTNSYNGGGIVTTTGNTYGMYTRGDTLTGYVGSSQNDSTNYYAEKIAKIYNSDGSITIGYQNVNSDGSLGTTFNKTFYSYDSANGVKGSTTGNIYGIYDIPGGAWEYTAAYVDNGGTNANTYSSSLSGKYVNVYTAVDSDNGDEASNTAANKQANYEANAGVKGDAVYETSTSGSDLYGSWNSDFAIFPAGINPFFVRGGVFNQGSVSGAFAFSTTYGGTGNDYGFRVVLVP